MKNIKLSDLPNISSNSGWGDRLDGQGKALWTGDSGALTWITKCTQFPIDPKAGFLGGGNKKVQRPEVMCLNNIKASVPGTSLSNTERDKRLHQKDGWLTNRVGHCSPL